MKKAVIVAGLTLLFLALGTLLASAQIRPRIPSTPAQSQAGGLPALNLRVQQLKAEVVQLTAIVAAQQVDITALKSAVAALNTDVKSLQDAVAAIQDAVTGLKDQNNWAVVDASGTLVRHSGNSGVTAAKTVTGTYVVTFADRDVTACAYTATIGDVGKASAAAGFITVSGGTNPTDVQVQTFDKTGVAADSPFHLHISCP